MPNLYSQRLEQVLGLGDEPYSEADAVRYLRQTSIGNAKEEEIAGYCELLERYGESPGLDLQPEFDFIAIPGANAARPSLNVRLAAVIVLGSLGVKVAHSRSRGPRDCAGFLESIGLPAARLSPMAAELYRQFNFCILFRGDLNPMVAKALRLQSQAGGSTLKLALPLVHPASPARLLVAVPDMLMFATIGEAMTQRRLLGAVVAAEGYLFMPTAQQSVTLCITEVDAQYGYMSASVFGLESHLVSRTRPAEQSAKNFELLLAGLGTPQILEQVIYNAAYGLCMVHPMAPEDAAEIVRTALRDGTTSRYFDLLRDFLNG